MTTDRHLERDLPDILGDIAMGRYPDYIDDVLATTAQRRQRPGWTFPERWLPVELVEPRAPVARLPWRQLGVLALIALLLAALVVAYVGSQQQRLPPPFGVAANGLVVYVEGGDIYTADPSTGAAKAIIVSPETEVRPIWSLDGTRLAFERKVQADTGPGLLFVANKDGSGLVRITDDPSLGPTDWSFSPDGRSIVALSTRDQTTAIMVVASDGSGSPTIFDDILSPDPPTYRPDGSEILVNGRRAGDSYRGVYALDPATGHVRTVIPASESADIHYAAWSPDGTRIAYSIFDPTSDDPSSRSHIVAADGTGDILVNADQNTLIDAGGTWSNDGTRLVVVKGYSSGTTEITRNFVVPADQSSAGVEIDCLPGLPSNDCIADWIWSPDDSAQLGTPIIDGASATPQFLADPLSGVIRKAPWAATGYPAWQRVAR